jgi:AraC-like DNA-binding protein
MDALAGLLDGPRARGAFVLRSVLAPPWSIRIEDRSPLTLVAALTGEAWVVGDDGTTAHLTPGDVGIARGIEPYTVSHDPARPPDIVILPGQRCTTPDGVELHDLMTLGVRTWGNDPSGSTVLLIGSYQIEGEVSRRLLDALPARCMVPAALAEQRLVGLLAEEAVKDRYGQQAVLDRLLDLLLITTLRTWFDQAQGDAPAWYQAQVDPIVGPALRLLHDSPDQPWTVETLAHQVGVARPTLARRFKLVMGEGPMTYLTDWRMALAADLLAEPGATVGSVAHRVGYATPFALSTAFKRATGISPSAYAARVRAGASPAAVGSVSPAAVGSVSPAAVGSVPPPEARLSVPLGAQAPDKCASIESGDHDQRRTGSPQPLRAAQ